VKPCTSLTGLLPERICLHFQLCWFLLEENRPTSMSHLLLPAKPEDSPSQWLLTLLPNHSLM
jgi:hypothetical protein